MDELVGVAFERCVALVFALARATEDAAMILPGVFDTLEADISLLVIEAFADRVLSVGFFRAIDAAPRQQGGEIGDGDAEQLVVEDVVNARLPVGDFLFQTFVEPFGDFAQEDAAFADRVEKARVFVAPQLAWQQIEHPVHHLRRRENFIVAEVGQTRQHIRVVSLRRVRVIKVQAGVKYCVRRGRFGAKRFQLRRFRLLFRSLFLAHRLP